MSKGVFRSYRFWVAAYALSYAVLLLLLGGATSGRLYAPSKYHRLQADAILDGHLYLANSIQQIGHDLAWHDGQVNHVWGLGVGLWLTPFEALWRTFGQKWFPDRIALGVAFGLLAWYTGCAAVRLSRRFKRPEICPGFILLILCNPVLWTLNHGPRLIYEETSLYAYLVSLGILVATIKVACLGGKRDFWICAILAGFIAIVRPTHGIYGLAGMVVCSCLVLLRRGQMSLVFAANGVYVAGLLLLALTNISRFGSPFEFGHKLTATPDIIIYTTRLESSMADATFFEAGCELFGALFLAGNLERERRPTEPLYPGEAPYYRWRDPYVTTFDLGWFGICFVGALGASLWLSRKVAAGASASEFGASPDSSGVLAVLIWSLVGVGGLMVFYYRLATFSSRYLLDFGPAFTALALFPWWTVMRKWALPGLLALACWSTFEISSAQFLPAPVPLRRKDELVNKLRTPEGRSLAEYEGTYDLKNPAEATGIMYNGYGWHPAGGAGSIVSLAIDRPEFIELVVSPRFPNPKGQNQTDQYRAMIGGRFLPDPEIRIEDEYVRVRFSLPDVVKNRNGDELLFLWFGRDYETEERSSQRIIYSVRWR